MTDYCFSERLGKDTIDIINEIDKCLSRIRTLTKEYGKLGGYIGDIQELLNSILQNFEIASENEKNIFFSIYYAKKLSVEDLKSIIEEKENEEINKCL